MYCGFGVFFPEVGNGGFFASLGSSLRYLQVLLTIIEKSDIYHSVYGEAFRNVMRMVPLALLGIVFVSSELLAPSSSLSSPVSRGFFLAL
jgi:hypothetical protein